MIVKFRDGASATKAGPESRRYFSDMSFLAGAELNFVREMGTGAQVFALPQALPLDDVKAIAQRIANDPTVEYAEPDVRMYPTAVPNDTQYTNQWHLNDPFGGVNAPAAWDITTGSASTVVAVLDTGSTPHPDLIAKLLPGYDFMTNADPANDGDGRDPDASDPGDWLTAADKMQTRYTECTVRNSTWHGTAVAGVIAASTNNGRDISGLDWNAKILPVRVLGKCGGMSSDIADGMLWAAGAGVNGVPANPNPAKVLNMSLGSEGSCSNTYRSVFTQLTSTGTIIVTSAGNDNNNASHTPSDCPGSIAVAATARSGAKASYSSFGSSVTVTAPGGDGGDLITTGNTGTTSPGNAAVIGTSGTSFSAPVVSGIISLMLAVRADLTAAEATKILVGTVRPFPDSSCTTAICGAGIVDAAAAVRAARDRSLGVATMVGFQDADVGRPNTDLQLKVTNLSSGFMTVGNAFMVNGGGDFSVPTTTCAAGLAPDASCTLTLRFSPAAGGLRSGELQFTAGDGRTYRVSLAGFAYASAKIVEQTAGTSAAPQYIAKAADGNYWYTQPSANRVARMSPQGQVTEYPLPTSASNPFDIAAGPDGNMWLTQLDAGRIARVTPQGVITEFPLPLSTSQPRGIAAGPDGNLWFTEIATAKIGRITPQGTITEFDIPWSGATPRGIAAGPDGNLWFTDSGALSIGRLTPSGAFMRFQLPWASNNLRGITAGPDGNLWFVELTGDRVGRITPSGVMTEFPLPRSGAGPLSIVAGPDGAVWYTASSSNRVGRVSATGQITEYRLPNAGSSPIGIVVGPNNVMWITNSNTAVNKISMLSIAGVSGAGVFSDLWWAGNSENGWGMTVQQHGNVQFNVLFVYDNTGKPIWYAMPGCTWNADFTTCNGQLAKPTSSPLNNYNAAQFVPGGAVGTISLNYTSANTATLQYVINGIPGQKTIQRQTFGPVDNTPGLQVGDMWWAGDSQNGWGVSITQQYRTLFAAWYTYDQAGNATWYTMPGGTWSGNTYSGGLAAVTSSPWLGTTYNPALFSPSQVGTVSFAFQDANNATMTYTFTSGPFAGTSQTKQITRQPY
ncbi:MAG: S8 family serine peptidase [Betaproteobacteria bacterium]|nr:S8 family serine peptidase [Betaproteobacteria bacterium]